MAVPSYVVSVDAPIDGWNVFDSLDNMPPTAAIILDNLIPSSGTVETRKGTQLYADTLTTLPVETIANLNTDTTTLLIAASGGTFFDITDGNAVTEITSAQAYTNDRWQTQNFTTLSEEGVLILCNGVDEAIKLVDPYTSMVDIPFTKLVGEVQEAIAGNFIGVVMFKGRCYYWYDDDDAFWFSQAGSYQGEMTEFNLGTVAQRGGKITFITTWTQQDSGDGKDDFLVFVMSTGEVLVYQGDDPESIGFFDMVGRYTVAEPMSIRGHSKYGSDTIIMTKDGYVALSTMVQQGRISDVPAFSRLITGAITQRTETRADFFGWDSTLHAKEGLFIFNVPLSEDTFEQHVLNTITQKWCRFKGIQTSCMAVHDERMFGGRRDGTILAISEGTSDEANAIQCVGLPAFNYFEDTGHQKMLSAAQVFTTHSNPEYIDLRGYSDFNVPNITPINTPPSKKEAIWSFNPVAPPEPLGSYWDEDYWGGSHFTTRGWQNVSAYGWAITVLVRFSKINEGVSWRSTTMRYNRAGAQ